MQVKFSGKTEKLRLYQFPRKGNQPEDYHLILGKDKLGTDRVRTTSGGGKSFTYIKTAEQAKNGDQSYWLEGVIPSGTKIELVQEGSAPESTKIDKAPPPTPAKPEVPAATKTAPPKQRRSTKSAKP